MWKIHKKIHHHVWKHIARHGHNIHQHTYHIHHNLLHLGELILVWIIWFMSLMFASSSNLPNNSSFSYPIQKVSTLECRTLYRNDMPDSCKINLPRIYWANYWAYEDNTLYRSIYTALWAAPYSDSWNQKIWAHAWVDIATARGTPLYSIWEWEVYFAWQNSAYGNVVKIKYVYNWEIVYAIYAHMDKIIVKKWDLVSKWQKVWTVWNSWNTFGKLWGYHLHFEIDKDNHGRPAYSYTNCPDLSKWHYKIIQNWLCRTELFTYQYDPIRIFEANSVYVDHQKDESENINIDENKEDWEIESDNENKDTIWLEDLEKDISEGEIDKWKDVINNNNADKDNHNSAEDWDENSNKVIDKKEEVDLKEENKQDDFDNINENDSIKDDYTKNDEQKNVEKEIEQDSNQDNVWEIEDQTTNENLEKEDDPLLLELDLDDLYPLVEHFTKLWDIEMRSELKEKNLLLWETSTLDIEIFKKWQKDKKELNWFKWILQNPFFMITNNDKIDLDINYLQLITKWKAKVEITWKKIWKSSLIIEFGWKKIWTLDITVK